MATLIIPPYRAALLTNADGSPMSAAGDGSAVTTERQWYMFWQNVASQINDGAQAIGVLEEMITFGNHADRPDPGPWPDGALYVEQDRGSVLYQNQGGIWVYIAGQMFGTLSPDQRPTDLGPAADVGFAFRTSTDPARALAWNGGQWVETTPARYGTHAQRLAAPVANMVSGMLWIETDRGNAIYQNQAGTWLLLTGTMWGTLSPDQRPTDLGINDAGFTFLATTTPPRQFIWSSSAWVEITSGDVFGGAGLTHTNVVTKVGAAGQIVEGGITDLSAGNSGKLNISAAGNVGIGTPSPNFPLSFGTSGGDKIAVYDDGSNFYGIGLDLSGFVTITGGIGGGLKFFVNRSTEPLRLDSVGNIVLLTLRSTNPGGGSKQLWFDPADGNRVKYAP